MNRNNRKSLKKGSKKASGQRMINISGPGGFRLDFPVPRLPRWLGTPNLAASNSVYPRVNLDIPLLIETASITTGSLASVVNIDTSAIENWSTRFQSLFQEFAIVGARFEMRVTTVSSGQGLVLAYIDENSASAPTSAIALSRPHAEIPICSTSVDTTGSIHSVEWVARSYADLTWDPTSTSGVVAYLKLFASVAGTGTSSTTGAAISITGALAVCFRGFA